MFKQKNEQGLTLIELLITISVLAVVSAIALPVINNVVTSSNSNALQQSIKDAQAFIDKYSKSGVVIYDGLQTLSGYVDSDGDNVIEANEKIDTLTLDSKYSVSVTGSTQLGGSYTNGGVTAATITSSASGSATGGSQQAAATATFASSMWDGGPSAGFNNQWVIFAAATTSDGSEVEYSILINGNPIYNYYDASNTKAYSSAWFTHSDASTRNLYSSTEYYGMSTYNGYTMVGIPNLYQGAVGTTIQILARPANNPSAVTYGPTLTTQW